MRSALLRLLSPLPRLEASFLMTFFFLSLAWKFLANFNLLRWCENHQNLMRRRKQQLLILVCYRPRESMEENSKMKVIEKFRIPAGGGEIERFNMTSKGEAKPFIEDWCALNPDANFLFQIQFYSKFRFFDPVEGWAKALQNRKQQSRTQQTDSRDLEQHGGMLRTINKTGELFTTMLFMGMLRRSLLRLDESLWRKQANYFLMMGPKRLHRLSFLSLSRLLFFCRCR